MPIQIQAEPTARLLFRTEESKHKIRHCWILLGCPLSTQPGRQAKWSYGLIKITIIPYYVPQGGGGAMPQKAGGGGGGF